MAERKNKSIFDTVVPGDYCIGCGLCAALDDHITIKSDVFGKYVAQMIDGSSENDVSEIASQVCPFAEGNPDENTIGKELYAGHSLYDSKIGYHYSTYAGWVNEDDYRESGSSGGMVTWLLVTLIEQGHVDYVVHVGESGADSESEDMFEFSISKTATEIRQKSKSRYYPIEMSKVVRHIRNTPGRYAVVGLPCFVKALRLACRQSKDLNERVAFCVGIVCGHLKSRAFAELLGWQAGIKPSELNLIDFRAKIPDRPANSYGCTACGENSKGEKVEVTRSMSEVYGGNWGYGFFKYKACDFCDDVLAETADIAIGDAWLPEYTDDYRGTNVIVLRSKKIHEILRQGYEEKKIHLDALTPREVAASQGAGLRHRRDGLAYRLYKKEKSGEWIPKKRVDARFAHLSLREAKIQDLREQIAEASHTAFYEAKLKSDLEHFTQTMKAITYQYDRLYKPDILKRIFGKLKRILRDPK